MSLKVEPIEVYQWFCSLTKHSIVRLSGPKNYSLPGEVCPFDPALLMDASLLSSLHMKDVLML